MSKLKRSGGKGVGLKSPPKKKGAKALATPLIPAERQIYAVHPGVAVMQKWITELKVKTGRSLEEWIKHIKRSGPESEKNCREWLQESHSLGTNAAGWLTEKAFGGPAKLAEDTAEGYLALAPKYIEQMYGGAKEALRPIHNELLRLARLLGDDVRICPCKTIVPLYRRHVFAQIKPASAKRIDLGFALGEEPFTARLRDTGGQAKKDRITHSVTISSLEDIDLQVKRWLKQAYERDGG